MRVRRTILDHSAAELHIHHCDPRYCYYHTIARKGIQPCWCRRFISSSSCHIRPTDTRPCDGRRLCTLAFRFSILQRNSHQLILARILWKTPRAMVYLCKTPAHHLRNVLHIHVVRLALTLLRQLLHVPTRLRPRGLDLVVERHRAHGGDTRKRRDRRG
jgi:hypothetical protein